ncbi:dynein light chain Tctex-type protein 2B-like [Watersipora subatra]|uniref:dynein light chain Tctex-type protein 2B-like n=1 Tax=Watersipora subatra TaxID=2589382 RepID=UPI00355B238D
MSKTELESRMLKLNLAPPVMKPKEARTRPSRNTKLAASKVTGKANGSVKTSRGKTTARKSSQTSVKSDPKTAGPSIFSILITRQLARNYVKRFRQGRQQQMIDRPIPPTYQLEPKARFDPLLVKPLIKKVVDARMRTFRYQQTTAALLSKILATECKDAAKTLDYSRYKLVCQVFIGEKKDQSASISSQCAWDTNFDNVVTYNWQSANVYCIVTMHGIYQQ